MGRRGNATTPAKNALAADSAESVDAMQLGPAAEQTEPCPYCDTCKNLTGETVKCSSCEAASPCFAQYSPTEDMSRDDLLVSTFPLRNHSGPLRFTLTGFTTSHPDVKG